MPYLQQDPNDEPANTGTGATTGGGDGAFIGGGGQGATTTAGGASGASPAPTHAPGGYTNLLSYLGANQGAGATTGKAAENVVDQAGHAADKAISDYSGAGAQAVAAGTATVDPTKLSNISNGVVHDQYSGPKSIDAGYHGLTDPNTLGESKPAYSAVQTVVGNGTAGGLVQQTTGGQAGVAGLLKNAYAQPSYTAGENNLDAFLAGGTAGGQQALQQANTDWNGEGAKMDRATAGINAAITGGQNTSKSTQKTYDDAIAEANAKAKAWAPSFDTGEVHTPAALPGQYTSPPTNNIGISGDVSSGGSSNEPSFDVGTVGGAAHTLVNAVKQASPGQIPSVVKQTSPGVINHAIANSDIPAKLGGAGAPIQGGNVVQQAVQAPIQQAAKASSWANKHRPHFAHGGEVPSYSELMQFLKGKR